MSATFGARCHTREVDVVTAQVAGAVSHVRHLLAAKGAPIENYPTVREAVDAVHERTGETMESER
jgi:hypothetical protein